MKRIISFIILLCLLLCYAAVPVGAAGKEQANKDIAIVFDNSWSMYVNDNVAWCRATYAMEVFADMMNEGDTMRIYPMHPVEIDGASYDEAHPATISGPKDAGMIRRMYTTDAQGTPVTTIDAGHDGLKNATGEKWLIVLTDGTQFAENRDGDELDPATTKEMLSERLSKYSGDMNVLYLGIGQNAAMPDIKGGGQFQSRAEKAGDSGEVLSKLTEMCNMIFGRDTLPSSGSSLSFDVSMKKLIVFVQGKGISGVSVKDAGGAEIGKRVDEQATHFSDKGAGRDGKASAGTAVDDNLQGMMVTYVSDSGQPMLAGSYAIDYSGEASSVTAYYEPDVDLVVQLVDEAGNVLQGTDEAYEGEYTLRYGLLDNQTGQLTESELLGNTHYDVEYSINGESHTASSDQKSAETSVTLKANDTLQATITAEYLSGYRITKSGPDFGWPELGFHIVPMTVDVSKLALTVTGGSREYQLSRLEEDGRYHLTAAYDGVPVPTEAMKVSAVVDGSNIPVEAVPAGDGYDLLLKYNGDPVSTDTGDFELSASVEYTNSDGESGVKSIDPQPFTVINDGYGLGVQIEQTQTYYQISRLAESDPMIIRLTKDGEPLTDDELAAVMLEIDSDGLPYETELMPGQSAIALRLTPGDGAEAGTHKIVCHAGATDPLGQQIEGEDSVKVELQKYPRWMRWLVISLAALLLLTLLLLFLNTKVLPKKVLRAGDSEFSVGGRNIPGIAKVAFKRESKSLELAPPAAPAMSYVSCSAKLLVAPVSPRRIPSAKRKMAVTEVRANNDVSSVEVGAAIYERDKATGKFVKESSGQTLISNNSVITVNGTALNQAGRKKTAILTQQLRFK